MKKMFLVLCGLSLTSCAFLFRGSPPPTGATDTMLYFVIDVTELPGAFQKIVFHSADKTWSIGTAWDDRLSDKKKERKYILSFTSLPTAMPTYWSEIHTDNSGFFTGGRYEMYVMSPQESPLRLPKSNTKAAIKWGGAFYYKLHEGGFFKGNKFEIRACPQCPGEKEALALLAKISEEGEGLLTENNYGAKVKARLAELK